MNTKSTKRIASMALAAGLAAASPWAWSQEQGATTGPMGPMMQDDASTMQEGMMGYGAGPGYGYGPGPGVGMGPGMMGGYGPGFGMGPGMMGMGPGMMGGMMGMGPGMMGGYGPGMGMGMGMGPGAMMGPGAGMGPIAMLDLTQEQQRKINSIHDQLRKQVYNVQGQIADQQARLRDLYIQEQPDPKQVGDVYTRIATLQGQIAQARTQAHNQIQGVLTPEQKQQLSQWRRGMFGPTYGGPGTGQRGMTPSR